MPGQFQHMANSQCKSGVFVSIAVQNNQPLQIAAVLPSLCLAKKNDVLCAGATQIITVFDEIIVGVKVCLAAH